MQTPVVVFNPVNGPRDPSLKSWLAYICVFVFGGGGGDDGVTITVAEPTFPPIVALMVADPPALPVTRPFALTEATTLFVVDQVAN